MVLLPRGLNLEEWVCGRVLYPGNKTLGIKPQHCGALIDWIPSVHVRIPGREDAHAIMGAHALCSRCRAKFKLEDLKAFSMWQSVLQHLKNDGFEPKDKDIEIEWLSVDEYIKQTSIGHGPG